MITAVPSPVGERRREAVRRWLAATGPITTGAIVCVWVWIAIRAIPTPYSDYGVFLAVAERLRAGERLYAQVWDNKDPLVYLSLAGARSVGVAGLWTLELVWLIAVAVAVYCLARRHRIPIRWSALVGLACAPLMVLGSFYFMGTTHLPGVALALVALALADRERLGWAGAALGVLALFKVVMLPLAVALVVVAALSNRQTRRLSRTVAAALVIVGGGLLLLMVRGELGAYTESLLLNVGYSQTSTTDGDSSGLGAWLGQHTAALADWRVGLVVVVTTVVAIIAWRRRRRLADEAARDDVSVLLRLLLAALVVEVLTLLVTGKFVHHAEVLLVSSTIAVVLAARIVCASQRWGTVATGAILVVTAFLAAGAPSPLPFWHAVVNARATWQSTAAMDRVTALLAPMPPTTFAMVGQGNDLPRSAGLEAWSLGCPRIAQRPFDPAPSFDSTLACLADVPLVVVAPDAGPEDGFPAWNAYVGAARDLLARDFDCRVAEGLTVCERRTAAGMGGP